MVSVIITAFNTHKITTIHVREAMRSTLVPDEIIVVNDHGDPSLKDMLKKLSPTTKIIYAYVEDDIAWNYTGARNLGVWLSSGDLLISEDSDNIPARTLYADMLERMNAEPYVDMVQAGRRPIASMEDALTKPFEEWVSIKDRAAHDDSFMIRREAYLKVRGYDERFAGAYAWACTEWTRRIGRAGIKVDRIETPYWTVHGGDTRVCECEKSKEERAKTIQCKDCGLAFKRRSYRNYGMARKNEYIQPPGGILNFKYNFQIL
ncbi:MAG TPA: glycosyltransferase [bacterium]|nr:glycosyltransferase [bacterium]